jgi:hypothetical protein
LLASEGGNSTDFAIEVNGLFSEEHGRTVHARCDVTSRGSLFP